MVSVTLRTLICMVVLSFASLWGVCAQSRVEEVTPRVDSVVEYTNRGVTQLYLYGDMAQAQRDLESALCLDTLYAPAHYTLSQLFMYSDASRSAQHALVAYQQDSANYWYLDAYGRSLLSERSYAKAQQVYEQILEQQPRDVNAYRLLAILYQRANEAQRAIALLDTAELRVGYNPYLMDIKRQLLLSTDQSDRAVEQMMELIAQMPYDADLRVSMAELYGSMGRDSMAYVEYLEALSIDSMSFNALVSLGGYMSERGEYGDYLVVLKRLLRSDEASLDEKIALVEEMLKNRQVWQSQSSLLIEVVETLVTEYPRDLRVAEMQVNFFIAKGSLEVALILLKGHIERDEPHEYYYEMVIDIERYLNRVDSAEHYTRLACEVFEDNGAFVESLAHMLTYHRRYEEALEQYNILLEMSVDSVRRSEVWCMIGDMCQFGGLTKESYEAYERSLDYVGDNVLTLNNYAYAISVGSSSKRELKRALEMSQMATQMVDGSPTYLDTHGWVLYKLGEYEEAKLTLRRAVSLDADKNSEIALHYAAVLLVLGEDAVADIYWGRAAEWGAEADQVAEGREEAQLRREKSKK